MKKFKTLAVVFVFLFCLCGLMTGCDSDSKNDTVKNSVISIKLKYNDNEIPDDSLSVNLSESPLTFTAEVQVTGKASKDFTLTSSDTDIATVSDKTVTLLAEGQTTITATAVGDSTKTHAITLNVTGETETGPVISIKLKYNQQEITDDLLAVIFAANSPLTFTAEVQVTGGASTDFTLASSNTKIATVSGKTVTLVAAGQTTITASAVADPNKKHAITLNAGYSVTVTGGTADITTAIPNQTVTLTPEIPVGKIFLGWKFNLASIQTLTVNSFSMPSRNVTVTLDSGDDKPYYITNNFGEDSSTELLVQWHSYSAPETQTLQYVEKSGSFPGTGIQVTGNQFQGLGNVGVYAPRNIFRTEVTGLSPNTEYKYRVGYEGAWSAEYNHLTSGGDEGDFSFTVVSDPQSEAHVDMTNALRAADSFDANHRFYLFGGDMVDNIGGRPGEIISYTNAASEFNIKRPIVATQGNHDTHYIDGSSYRFGGAEVFNAFITFPDNGGDTSPVKSERSQSYYFYYNKVLIIMLNTLASNDDTVMANPGGYTKQANWLKGVLKNDRDNNLSRYTIVVTHIGPFGGRESSRWLTSDTRVAFTKIFTDYNVDIVFSGHDHVYGRSNPIKITQELTGNDSDFTKMYDAGDFNAVANGTVFSIVSATGPKFYTVSKSDTWIPRYFVVSTDDQEPGVYVNVKVTATKLIVTAKKTTGAQVDTYEVTKK